ncbi:hypothetical protein STCU_00044 [Strigomonas culicis]|uniref:Serine protease n=1 Tax=Strigomonas culicis TaxID=28005 RepID=S9V8X8_9TRYP|nr:hypothetical protein STCU_00044 [Strigomonas culicis]|eukprot:EPY37253.1 hypothetical protein STCU_00044 [Strigomonas culicis]
MMKRHGLFEIPSNPQPCSGITRSVLALYWKDVFLGNCVAVSERIVVSAGHHFNLKADDVGDFSVLVDDAKWLPAEYVAKNTQVDILVFWLTGAVPAFVALRGFLPQAGCSVVTVWRSPKPPHDTIVSPGVVIESDLTGCLAKGTVSTTGTSGAPVLDFFGDHVVGLHLFSNTRDGSRVSGFLPARKMVAVLAEMGVVCRS